MTYAHLDDARVATGTIGVLGADFAEESLHHGRLREEAGHLAARRKRVGLGLRNQRLNKRAQFFSFAQGRLDTLVLNQILRQVNQQRLLMTGRA